MLRLKKSILLLPAGLVALVSLFVWWSHHTIQSETQDRITEDLTSLPAQKVGLVLGTSKTLANGYKNYYFYYRIDAAERLYKSGKVRYLIVSGDHSLKHYNEPEDMTNELVARGIPREHIFQDFAGLRTLDSVLRAQTIFGQKAFIIISQKFHNERAVFIARKHGIEAYGYNAEDVNRYAGFKTQIREYFARAKVFLDFLFGVTPKFGGEKITIP
ncbi:SanA/YdcF family protein [Bergeyella sp. RCAD1439]|uniref:SanA/YdcF family protein n=1 Tax=Bergeyella anatis TaxID=3113737 RepID=UPI002E18630F|nr:ElyC/SanA/YdcF family protein [Bergeyella sp. RCAD1439]